MPPEDQKVVGHLAASLSPPPFRERIRPWRLVGQAYDFNTLASEDLVEAATEPGVPIPEQDLDRRFTILLLPEQVSTCCTTQVPVSDRRAGGRTPARSACRAEVLAARHGGAALGARSGGSSDGPASATHPGSGHSPTEDSPWPGANQIGGARSSWFDRGEENGDLSRPLARDQLAVPVDEGLGTTSRATSWARQNPAAAQLSRCGSNSEWPRRGPRSPCSWPG